MCTRSDRTPTTAAAYVAKERVARDVKRYVMLLCYVFCLYCMLCMSVRVVFMYIVVFVYVTSKRMSSDPGRLWHCLRIVPASVKKTLLFEYFLWGTVRLDRPAILLY